MKKINMNLVDLFMGRLAIGRSQARTRVLFSIFVTIIVILISGSLMNFIFSEKKLSDEKIKLPFSVGKTSYSFAKMQSLELGLKEIPLAEFKNKTDKKFIEIFQVGPQGSEIYFLSFKDNGEKFFYSKTVVEKPFFYTSEIKKIEDGYLILEIKKKDKEEIICLHLLFLFLFILLLYLLQIKKIYEAGVSFDRHFIFDKDHEGKVICYRYVFFRGNKFIRRNLT